MNESICKGCGAKILWAINPATGGKIPLDIRAPIYRVLLKQDGTYEALKEDQGEFGVSHFATCSKANDFSRSKPKP
jgi:hypothetical protein